MEKELAILKELLNKNTSFEFNVSNTIARDTGTQSIIIEMVLLDENTIIKGQNEEHFITMMFFDENGYQSNDTICQFTSNFWGELYLKLENKINGCSHSTSPKASWFYKGFESLETVLEEYNQFVEIIKELLKNEPKFKDFKLVE